MTQALMDIGRRMEPVAHGGKSSGEGGTDSGDAFADAIDQAVSESRSGRDPVRRRDDEPNPDEGGAHPARDGAAGTEPGGTERASAEHRPPGLDDGDDPAGREKKGRHDHRPDSAVDAATAAIWAILPQQRTEAAGARASLGDAKTDAKTDAKAGATTSVRDALAGARHAAAAIDTDAPARAGAAAASQVAGAAGAGRGPASLSGVPLPTGNDADQAGQPSPGAAHRVTVSTGTAADADAAATRAGSAAFDIRQLAPAAVPPQGRSQPAGEATRTAAGLAAGPTAASGVETERTAFERALAGQIRPGAHESASRTSERGDAAGTDKATGTARYSAASTTQATTTAAQQVSAVAIHVPTPTAAAVNSTPVAAQTPVPTPFAQAQPDIAGILAQLRGASDGTYQLHARVHPAELGAVAISATVQHGALSITLTPDQTAQQAISQSLTQLRHHLADQGFTGVNVGLGSPGQSAGNGGRGDSDRAQGRDHPLHHGPDTAIDALDAADAWGAARRRSIGATALDRML